MTLAYRQGMKIVITIYAEVKMKKGVGAGIYSEDLQIRQSHRLPDDCIERTACLVQNGKSLSGNITIFVRNQALRHVNASLCRVPGLSNTERNEAAEDIAVQGS